MQIPEILFYIGLFLAIGFAVAFFLKKKYKAQLFLHFVSIIKSKKPLPFFQKFARFKRFFILFANAGLILGFGAVAVDYIYGQRLSRIRRAILFIASFALLYIGSFLVLGQNANAFVSSNSILIFSSFALFGLAGFSILLLAVHAVEVVQGIFSGVKTFPGVAPIIPGVQLPNVPIYVPLHGWLSLLIILVVHESFHGILACVHKIKLKSAGLILAGFLPIGAFVEPDEKQFSREKPLKRLQVLSVGSMSNFAMFAVVGLLYLGVFSAFVAPFAEQKVVVYSVSEFLSVNGTLEKAPAFGVLNVGDTIVSANGVDVNSIPGLEKIVKGSETLNFGLKDINGVSRFVSLQKNSAGSIGATFAQPVDDAKVNPLALFIAEFLFWLFMLSLFVAIANFMPFWAFDGGQMVKLLLLPYFGFLKMDAKETEKFIGRLFVWIVGILLLINALPLLQF